MAAESRRAERRMTGGRSDATEANTTEESTAPILGAVRRRVATASLSAGLVSLAAWFGWRLGTLGSHPIQITVLLIEISGWVGGVLVALGLIAATNPRELLERDDTYRYGCAVAACVRRTRASDLHQDLWTAVQRLRTRTVGGVADRAMVGVLVDGPRRIALVVTLALGLLVGVAPSPTPPVWALVAVATGSLLISLTHVVASGGRIRLGDRTRWSFATLGEVLSRADRADLAPRRWVGTVGTIVILNLAIALRGMSDRWTHGLPAMPDADRVVAMGWAAVVIVGGLYALRTIPTPQLGNAHLVSRRLEERTARQSALGATVCVGLVGLLAGVLPGNVDAGSNEPSRIEPVTHIEADTSVIGDIGD
jgi:hypothetical protein